MLITETDADSNKTLNGLWFLLIKLSKQKVCAFLVLLDYGSRAHEIEICPSSVHAPICLSSVRVTIISEPNAQISFKFRILLSLDHTLRCFLIFWKLIFLRIFSVFINMGPYGRKNFKKATTPTNYSQKFSNFSWNFLSMVLRKVLIWTFDSLKLSEKRVTVELNGVKFGSPG